MHADPGLRPKLLSRNMLAASAQANAGRAVAAYAAMQKHFQVLDGTLLYRQTYPWRGGNRYSFVWEFSRALVGTLALAGVPGDLVGGANFAAAVQDRFAALDHYWDGRAHPPAYQSYVLSEGGGDTYHDDNVWLALAHVQQYRMGLTTSLDRASRLFSLAKSAWDANVGDPHPGGIFWVDQRSGFGLSNHDRGTGATAGNAELGYHLHLLTGSASFSGDGVVGAASASLGATNMANWVAANADSSADGSGLYWNALRGDGSIDTNLWSYNQGVMLGANVLRYQLTADDAYLSAAEAIAERTLSTYANFLGQPPSFNVMLFQNLLMLHPYARSSLQTAILESMQSYADWAWATRHPETSVFFFDDAGQPVQGTSQAAQLRDQGAMTQLFALLAWNPADYGRLT